MPKTLYSLLEHDAHTNVLYMVLGALLMLSAYHFAMFFRNRDRSYLLYSSYTFFSFVAYMPVVEGGFLRNLSDMLLFDDQSKSLFIMVFNCIYFLFFADFLNIKSAGKNWYQVIVYPVLVLLFLSFFSFGLQKMFGLNVFDFYKKLFIILISVQTAVSFYILIKIKNNLKYYILFGGLILFVCSLLGTRAVRELPWIDISRETGNMIYFVGLLVENLAFSLALGHKQKLIFDEKASYHKDFEAASKKNEQLREEMSRENELRLTTENDKIKYLREISELKLSVLQSQLNPHFIFNALNSIKYCIQAGETDKATDYLFKFSKIIRAILAASKMREFTLAQELHTLQLYVDIENLRFTDIDFKVKVADNINPNLIKVPPMVLQPYIENAILHGVADVADKRIELEVFNESDQLKISITDNGIGRAEAAKLKSSLVSSQKSLGTQIARGMLKSYFSPQEFSVEYSDLYPNKVPCGTRVLISLPQPR